MVHIPSFINHPLVIDPFIMSVPTLLIDCNLSVTLLKCLATLLSLLLQIESDLCRIQLKNYRFKVKSLFFYFFHFLCVHLYEYFFRTNSKKWKFDVKEKVPLKDDLCNLSNCLGVRVNLYKLLTLS